MAVVVRSLESTTAREGFDASAIVTLDGRTERLTFRRYGDHPRLSDRNETFDPFAVALLVPAMIRGEPLVIEGDLDEWLLVHHHVGAHGEDDAVFTEQYDHARRVADRLGVPIVGARCDLRTAYRGMKFLHSVTLRNVAASPALDHLFAAFHYASTETFATRVVLDRSSGLSTIDPALLPLFTTTLAVWLPFGGDVTRLRKSAEGIHDDRLCPHVLVCVRGFRRGRSYAVLRTLRWALGTERNENDIDLLRYLHDRGFPFPTWALPAVALVLALHRGRHSLDPRDRSGPHVIRLTFEPQAYAKHSGHVQSVGPTRLGAAHTLSLDARLRPPGYGSLGDVCAPTSCLRWPSTPSRGAGQPRACLD